MRNAAGPASSYVRNDRVRRFETARAGDVRIATSIDGEGRTFVILPSYGRDGLDDFDGLTERITGAGWRVLRPQPRGIAGSVGPMQDVDFKALANDVAIAIEQFGTAPAVVLGHAFGNFVGRVLAVERPDLVGGLVLAAASATRVRPEINATPFIAGDPTRPEAERLAALRLAFFAPGHDPHPWLAGWYPPTLAMQRAAIDASGDVQRYWSGGTCPLLELIPRCDPFKPRAMWHELRDNVGDRVTTVVIDDASHALFPEQPDRVVEAVLKWLAVRTE